MLLVLTFRWWPASYGVFAALVLAAALGAENLNSLERYGLNAFPLALSLAADTGLRGKLENLRRALAAAIANTITGGPDADPTQWLQAVAAVADLDRAVAAAYNLRDHTTTAATAARTRHPQITGLLDDDSDADDED